MVSDRFERSVLVGALALLASCSPVKVGPHEDRTCDSFRLEKPSASPRPNVADHALHESKSSWQAALHVDLGSYIAPTRSDAQSLCVPACLMGSVYATSPRSILLFSGTPRDWAGRFADLLARKPKPVYVAGVGVTDISRCVAEFNDLRRGAGLKPVSGMFVNRQSRETRPAQLQRVHELITNSLGRGYPPTLVLSSFSVSETTALARVATWRPLTSHAVLLSHVFPSELGEGSLSFAVRVVDPFDGRTHDGVVLVEGSQPFGGWIGSPAKGHWDRNTPHLRVEIPGLSLGRERVTWSSRTVVGLDYVVIDGEKNQAQ